jgi:murein DD-endopeptidase MepM/ murein hydrolase activator NlpD
MTSVLDHSPKMVANDGRNNIAYTINGQVLAFTGELGVAIAPFVYVKSTDPTRDNESPCYPPPANSGRTGFSVNGLYHGTWSNATFGNCLYTSALNYDGHPGYDYTAAKGTPVYAAAEGDVVAGGCIKNGISDKRGVSACDLWGYVGLVHANGFVTQYGHLDATKQALPRSGHFKKGALIGYSGKTAPVPLNEHLHFEVLKKGKCWIGYCIVDPYGWQTGIDPLESWTGVKNVRLWD